MKRRFAFVTTLLTALLALAGCGVQRPTDEELAGAGAPAPSGLKPTALQPLHTVPAVPVGPLTFLHTEGRRIVGEDGAPVQLSGCNIGGWLLLEPWICGLDYQENAETEKEIWDLMGRRFGEEAKQDLIKTFRERFFTEDDVRRIAELGMNCIRVPVWWRAVADPVYGGDIGYLDRCIDWCAKYGVYVIIDLQGAPGGQAKESSNVGEPANGGGLWKDEALKKQTVEWWKMIAARYKDNPVVAAYDVLNEGTAAPQHDDLVALYDALYKEIRQFDTKHILAFEAVWGFHLLPLPEDMGWENTVYSFHYYPRDMSLEQQVEAADVDLPRYNRTALYNGVPVYVGEFSPIAARHGGVDAFLKYREACEYLHWAWTFWTYKAIGENDTVLWGLYGLYDERPSPDLNTDSLESIKAAFEQFATEHSRAHPLLPAALQAPIRWEPDPDFGPGAVTLSLRDACVMPCDTGYLRYEWGWTPPNVGYWAKGDTIGWRAQVPAAGVYELGLRLANNSDKNRVQVWVDGVHVGNLSIPNSGGYRKFKDRALASLSLSAGSHTIEIGQADDEKGFLNLRHGWLKPARGTAVTPDETAIWLRPFNAAPLRPKSPLRVEWLNNPPNFGNWSPGEKVPWKVTLSKGGSFLAKAVYATPNSDSTLKVLADGQQVSASPLKSTGDWQKYEAGDLGVIEFKPGEHTLAVQWDIAHPTAPGNLREIRLERLP